jgi:hypothetical protein
MISIPAASIETRRAWQVLILVSLVVLMLVPFSNRALQLDDPFYVWVAQHIAKNPADFYGFTLNWNGLDEPVYEINKNPPGISYFLAAVGSLFGWQEPIYHSAFLLLAVLTAIGFYAVAERLTQHPMVAALVAIFSPVFVLSAINIMAEMGMLALYVWGLYFWIRGIKENRVAFLLAAGALTGLSTLTKYYGLTSFPLFLAYGFAEKRRIGWWVLALLPGAAIIAFYEFYTASLYGRGHITHSILYAETYELRRRSGYARALIGMAFVGGCTLPAALCSMFLWKLRVTMALAAGTVVAAAGLAAGLVDQFFVVTPELGEYKPLYAIQFALLIAAGANLFLLAARDFYVRRDATSVLLFLWFVGTFLFAVRFNWAINGRSLLAAALPAGLYVARAWELPVFNAGRYRWKQYAPLAPAACLAVLVGYADYTQANVNPTVASYLSRNFDSSHNTLWYQGHWGFQYYMEAVGGKHTDTSGMDVTDGDFLVTPYYNTAAHNLNPSLARSYWVMEFQPLRWLTTWNPRVGAGYYADAWGPMPFVFADVPPEKFMIVGIGFTGTLRVSPDDTTRTFTALPE